VMYTVTACTAQINPFKLERKAPPSLIEIQEAIEYNLNHIKIGGSDYYRVYNYPPSQQQYFYNYFSEKARQRMVELFEGKWTKEEIVSRVNASIESTLDTLSQYNGYYKEAKKIAQRDSLPLQRVWDSMIVIRRKQWGEDLLKGEVYVDYRVISIAGYLRDPRFLPYLKDMDKGNYVSKEVELALARYGEEPYYSNAIKKYTYGERFRHDYIWDLVYICSNDAIEEIYNYIMNENEESCDSNGECDGYWVDSGVAALQRLFNSKEYFDEVRSVEYEYYKKRIKQDKNYLKKVRSITEKYYKQFKEKEPDCENVPINAW